MRPNTTRYAALAAAAGLALLSARGAVAEPAQPKPDAADSHAPRPSATTGVAPSDAAARHAHRTACLRDARKKKLLGTQKTEFLKNCIGIPG